jgi:hypothetical protein
MIHRGHDVFWPGDMLTTKSLQQDAAHLAESEDGESR